MESLPLFPDAPLESAPPLAGVKLPDPLEANSPSLEEALAAADDGMQRALGHTEERLPDWGEQAYAFLVEFAHAHRLFISEDVSDASREYRMAQPNNDRAWGQLYRRAQKEQVIVKHGSGKSRRRHGSICPLWRSLVAPAADDALAYAFLRHYAHTHATFVHCDIVAAACRYGLVLFDDDGGWQRLYERARHEQLVTLHEDGLTEQRGEKSYPVWRSLVAPVNH